jgi:hypothetical protein
LATFVTSKEELEFYTDELAEKITDTYPIDGKVLKEQIWALVQLAYSYGFEDA